MAIFNNPTLMIISVGALVGIGASLLGTFLILRGNSLLVDAISHSIVLGIAVVWLLFNEQAGPLQIIGAALTGLLTVFLTELLVKSQRVKQDAAIGLVFPLLFSIGVLLINLYAGNVHVDIHTVLLGEIGFVWLNTVDIAGYPVPQSLIAMGVMTLLSALFIGLFFKELKLATFDRALAKSLGLAPGLLFYGLLLLTSGSAVAAFDAVGVVLFVAFVIAIPATSYLLTDRLEIMLLYGVIFSIISSVAGFYLAVWMDVSISGMMVLVTATLLLLAFLFGPRYGLIAQALERKNQQALNACRTLAVHLYNHENEPNQAEENVTQALHDHLLWSEDHAHKTIMRAYQQELIQREGELLILTHQGRAMARSILEPGQN